MSSIERYPYSWFECGCRLIPLTYPGVRVCSICDYDFQKVEEPSDGKAKTYWTPEAS